MGKGDVVLICLFTAHILQETIALGFSESTSDCQSANAVIDGFYRARVIIWFVSYVAHDVSRGDAGIQMMGRAKPWTAELELPWMALLRPQHRSTCTFAAAIPKDKKKAHVTRSLPSTNRNYYIEATIAFPNSEQLNNVAPSIWRSKS